MDSKPNKREVDNILDSGHSVHRRKFSEGLLNNDVILKNLNILAGQTILDAGCGNGYMSKEFSRLVGAGGKVYALDFSEQEINKLREEAKDTNIEPLVADITKKTPLEESSVDLVYLSTVFHVFSKSQIEGFKKEVKRLLRHKGKLAIVEIIKQDTPFGPPLHLRYSPEELKQAINLTPKGLVEAGQYFYMQIFENI